MTGNLISLPIAYPTKNMVSIVSDTWADSDAWNSVMGARPYELQQIQVSQFNPTTGNAENPGYFYFLSIGL